MYTIGLNEEQAHDVFQVLAGILQLGNIEFVSTGGAQIRDKSGKFLMNLLKFCVTTCCTLSCYHGLLRALSKIYQLTANLFRVREALKIEIYYKIYGFSQCNSNYWPQHPALDRLKCGFVPRAED